jgi:hypothetical protein
MYLWVTWDRCYAFLIIYAKHFAENTASFCQNLIITLVFENNCDQNIDTSCFQVSDFFLFSKVKRKRFFSLCCLPSLRHPVNILIELTSCVCFLFRRNEQQYDHNMNITTNTIITLLHQGCQTVYFLTNLGNFWRTLEWKMLVYFMPIRNILRPFGIFYGHIVTLW